MFTVDAAYAAFRFTHFAALLLSFGWLLFLICIAPRDLQLALARRAKGSLALLSAVALFSACAMVPLQIERIIGSLDGIFHPDTLRLFLTQTSFGKVWVMHLAAVAMWFIVSMLTLRSRSHRYEIALAWVAIALFSTALTGHAEMRSGWIGNLWKANAALHLLAVGAWLGSLIPLLSCLALLRQGVMRRAAGLAVKRFSVGGHVVVALVILTGVVNSLLIFGFHWPAAMNTYLILLIAKVALVMVMIAIAIWNRYQIVPRWRDDPESAYRGLLRGTLIELALGALALILVSVFASMDPG